MSDPLDTPPPTATPLTHALDRSLAQALAAPPLPMHFRERLLAAATQTRTHTAAARTKALEQEYEAERKRLRDGQIHLLRDAAALILGFVLAASACMHPLLPWIHAIWGVEGSTAMPVLAAVVGLGAGATVWLERFGYPPVRWGSGRG